METFAYIQTAVAHEDPTPEAELRSLKELGLTLPSSAWMGLAGIVLSASILLSQTPSMAFPATVASPTGYLNIRSGPGTGYAAIGGLTNGQRIEVISTSNGWYQLSSGGWVAGNYTTGGGGGGGGGTPGGGTPGGSFVTVTAPSGVNIRSGPGTGYAVIGGLAQGTSVRVINSSGGWYQLSSGGWIAGNYTSGGGSGSGGGGVPGGTAVVSTNGSPLLVRSSPGGTIVGSLTNGTRISLTGRTSAGYSQLTSGNWVSSSWIR